MAQPDGVLSANARAREQHTAQCCFLFWSDWLPQ